MLFPLVAALVISATAHSLFASALPRQRTGFADHVAHAGELAAFEASGSTGNSKAAAGGCADFESPYQPGIHLVELKAIGRQFLLVVPKTRVSSVSGSPLVILYHGFSDSPWYSSRLAGFPGVLERYGWIGLVPFAMNAHGTNGLGGVRACCPEEGCDEHCCRNGLHLMQKDENACGWQHAGQGNIEFTRTLVDWASDNMCVDRQKVFATGFSSGAMMSHVLGCKAADLFRAVAPISGDVPNPFCKPSRPISYISFCGSKDDEAHCQYTFDVTGEMWGKLANCAGAGGGGRVRRVSATSTCTSYDSCEGGNFVEWCTTEGLSHDISGHLRPDDISYLRPGSDLDATEYIFEKFSLLVDGSLLFWGHPTEAELEYKASQWPPPTHNDSMHLRRSRKLGADLQ